MCSRFLALVFFWVEPVFSEILPFFLNPAGCVLFLILLRIGLDLRSNKLILAFYRRRLIKVVVIVAPLLRLSLILDRGKDD